jgi:sulfur-oxidizing protein SoxA
LKRLVMLAALGAAAAAFAQDTRKEIQRYRDMVAEGSPAELFELEGEALWKKMDKCDLGLGPGVVKGAYARLPRYFKDADRVMDLEARLLHCMVTLQGRSPKEATARVFEPGSAHPREKASIELGRALFFHRVGPWDFSCASCHGNEGERIRMQELPVLYKPQYARPVMASWPAYRLSTSQFVTLQWRMNDCFRQMRTPEPNFGSETTVALIHFLTATAKGEPYRGPTSKR